MVSTELTRARRSQATLALDPIPASKAQSDPLKIAELDKHNWPRLRVQATNQEGDAAECVRIVV
jgi:hypothetical protein